MGSSIVSRPRQHRLIVMLRRMVSMALCTSIVAFWAASVNGQWGSNSTTVNFTESSIKPVSIDEHFPLIDLHPPSASIGPGVGCFLGACAGFEVHASGGFDLGLRATGFVGGNYSMAYKLTPTTLSTSYEFSAPVEVFDELTN